MALFCRDCANLMQPHAEDGLLKYACRTCTHVELSDEACVYYQNLDGLSEDKNQEMIHADHLIADPTLPRAKVRCKSCNGTEAVWFQTVAKEQERMSLTFVCLSCRAHWQE